MSHPNPVHDRENELPEDSVLIDDDMTEEQVQTKLTEVGE